MARLAALVDAPWLRWLLLVLCRQRARQSWLIEVRDRHLRDVDEDEGMIDALPGWTYSFHGMGLCLDGPGHEVLDVDFHDELGATIDPYFFARRIVGLDPVPWPEAQLRRLLPGRELLVAGLDELRDAGLIGHETSGHVFRLAAELEAQHAALAGLDLDAPSVRAACVAALGDPGAPATRARLHAWLRGLLVERRSARRVLPEVLPLLPAEEAKAICRQLLDGPIDSVTAQAVAGLGDDVDAVRALLPRFDPARHHPYPAHAVATFLLARGVARDAALELVERFAAVEVVEGYLGNPYLDHLAEALLEFAPERALPLVRRVLRRGSPASQERTAVLLALLGWPWCLRELEAAIHDVPADSPARRTLVGALDLLDSELARRRAAELRPADPEPDGRPGFRYDEVHAHHLPHALAHHRDKLGPTADRLRSGTRDL